MTEDEIIARADANYFGAWASIVRASDAGEVVEDGGVLIANAGLPLAWFNIGFITRELADAEAGVRRIASYFDERRLPFIVRVRAGVDAAAEAACVAAGLPYSDTVPGMVLDGMPAASHPCEGLAVRRVTDDAGLADHLTIIEQAFGMPAGFARQFLSRRALDIAGAEFYAGYVDGAPVATSALVVTDGTAGVFNVACLPSHRKRGFGEAMTWHVVHAGAAAGCEIASLQASEMGQPIYERMGFRLVAPYRTFLRA